MSDVIEFPRPEVVAHDRAHYIDSSELNWTSPDALEASWDKARDRAIQMGKRIVITLCPEHYDIKSGMVFPKGTPRLRTQSHRVRIRYPNGSTKTIKDILY